MIDDTKLKIIIDGLIVNDLMFSSIVNPSSSSRNVFTIERSNAFIYPQAPVSARVEPIITHITVGIAFFIRLIKICLPNKMANKL